MAASNPAGRTEKEYDDLVITSVLASSAYVGAATGGVGLLVGSIAGVIRSQNPVLFSAASGLQCFGLGTIFSATRQMLVREWSQSPATPVGSMALSQRQQTVASTISGAVAGGSMGALRSRSNIIYGAIFWGLAGLAGQEAWNARERAQGKVQVSTASEGEKEVKEPFWVRWSPMKMLSDDEYEAMLKERLLRVDADIAIIDEDIAKLKADQARVEQSNRNA